MKKIDIEQRSEEWFFKRKGCITGTTLKAILGTPKARQEAFYEVLAERLTVGVEMDYENPMERGTRLEPEATAMFEFETNKKVEQVGFCESDDNPKIANSPDGIIADTDDSEMYEGKCPLGKNYVKMWLTDEVPKDYKSQVIQYFVVNKKLKTLYFVAYHPNIPVHPLHIIEVKRKDIEADIKKAREEQEKFLSEVNDVLKNIVKI